MTRTFESGPARREATLIAIGVVGPSGSGKTKSPLRLCDGMRRVTPGKTVLIDTNNRRSLHHASDHEFDVVHMPPPYSPLDWRDATQKAVDMGARRIIHDSISDLHEGQGGILDMHEQFIDDRINASSDPRVREGIDDSRVRDRYNMSGWKYVKREQLKLKLWLFQLQVDHIFTFRAKEKIKVPDGGGKPIDMGWQPLGPEELIYELLLKCLLRPQADGLPTWTSDIIHERALIKIPAWFRDLFSKPRQLDEDIGEQLARWAAGGEITATSSRPLPPPPHQVLIDLFDACDSSELLEASKAEMKARWDSIPTGAPRTAVTKAFKSADERVTALNEAERLRRESE